MTSFANLHKRTNFAAKEFVPIIIHLPSFGSPGMATNAINIVSAIGSISNLVEDIDEGAHYNL